MKKGFLILVMVLSAIFVNAQSFENMYKDTCQKKDVKVKVGGDFALQYQSLSQSADTALIPLGSGINLPTANFNIIAHMAPGVRLHLTTYLSSRHHEEAWVKGGYLSMNQFPFLKSDFIKENMMFRVGMMEINYGDAHFRRSDNGHVIENPFVGNLVMDAFSTDPAVEIYFNKSDFFVMGAATSGTLKNQLVSYSSYTKSYTTHDMFKGLGFYGKIGYDKQVSEDLRLRVSLSAYSQKENYFGSLYYGDRTGSRYYLVMKPQTFSSSDVDWSSGHTSGRWSPGFLSKDNSMMANVFAKYKGLELFGTYESVKGTSAFSTTTELNFSQYAAELLYRFGGDEQYYVGGRYNHVQNDASMSVNRMQLSAGWFMTKNIMMKLEYVDQKYDNFISEYGANAGFNGLMFEATISF